MYTWTEKAEKRAKQLNLDERKAGAQATFAGEPLTSGPTATAWLQSGYVTEVAP